MKLNSDNYFSNEADRYYMSVSQYKNFLKCEACTVAELDGEWERSISDSLLIGSYVHAWNEGKLDKFKNDHPEIISSRGSTKGKLKKNFALADLMINALKTDALVEKVRQGEKEVIMTSELFGIPWKIMIDIYNTDFKAIIDLKTTRTIKSNETNFIEQYDYFLQMAVYAEVERLNRDSDEYFIPHILAVSKEAIPDKAIINLGTNFIPYKLFDIELNIDRIKKVKNRKVEPIRCGECDYCRSTKQLDRVISISEL